MIESSLRRAELNLTHDTWTDAVSVCRSILSKDADHVGALELLAKAQWKGSRNRDLIPTLGRLIALNPYEPGYHALKGAAHQSVGDYENALACYRRARGCSEVVGLSVLLSEAQDEMIRQLVAEDPIFRIRYARNPVQACKDSGFAQAAARHAKQLLNATTPAFRGRYMRPS